MARTKQRKRKPMAQKLPEEAVKTTAVAVKNTSEKKSNKKRKKTIAKREEVTSDSDIDLFSNPDKLRKLLDPYSKSQLIDFLIDCAVKDKSLFDHIRSTADRDESHRKIFIHGLAWDTTRDAVISAFQSHGEIEDCHVVMDRVKGKAKGFGFVIFKTRRGASKALKLPRKKIGNRLVSFQLASSGPVLPPSAQDVSGRKIYVNGVPADADPEKLLVLFAKFGEIEAGPMGFDVETGKSRGFALFVYKTQEGALKALEEPCKMFQGHQLQCQKASVGRNKLTSMPQQPAVAGVATQNMMLGQYAGINPAYGQFMAAPNLISSNQMNQVTQLGAGLGGYNASMLGPYGSANPNMGLQHVYSNPQPGLLDPARLSGSIPGYPSYMR